MEAVINNYCAARIDNELIKELVKRISRKKMIVSISFVPKGIMERLNMKYRNKNKPTDVLSFNMNEDKLLGDVIVCPEMARQNIKQYGGSLRCEIARLVAHGVLHLMGYRHGEKMFRLTEKLIGGVVNG